MPVPPVLDLPVPPVLDLPVPPVLDLPVPPVLDLPAPPVLDFLSSGQTMGESWFPLTDSTFLSLPSAAFWVLWTALVALTLVS